MLICLQAVYDTSNGFRHLRPWMCVALGHWHVHKFLCMLIWKTYSRTIFGPFWHELFPDKKFRIKPRLKTVTTIMGYLRLAYPRMRNRLHQLCANQSVSEQARKSAASIRDLMEWFMPVVGVADDTTFNRQCLFGRHRIWGV